MRYEPKPAPARAVIVSVGAPVVPRPFLAPSHSTDHLPHVPVVVIDFYPLATSEEAKLNQRKEAAAWNQN